MRAVAIFFMVLLVSVPAFAQDGRMSLDSERSTLTWTSEAPAEKIVGTASEIEGAVSWDLSDLEATAGTFQFPVDSMQSGNRLRDRHLKGRDWLNARANPNVIYRIERLEVLERSERDGQLHLTVKIHGRVTINGVEAANESRAQVAIIPESRRVRIQPQIEVSLRDHQVAGRRGAIGDTVGESIQIEGTLYGSW